MDSLPEYSFVSVVELHLQVNSVDLYRLRQQDDCSLTASVGSTAKQKSEALGGCFWVFTDNAIVARLRKYTVVVFIQFIPSFTLYPQTQPCPSLFFFQLPFRWQRSVAVCPGPFVQPVLGFPLLQKELGSLYGSTAVQ